MPYRSYYKILGLPNGASKKEVKKAFRRKVMVTHPDRNPNKNAQQEFYLVNQAYEILMGEIPLPKSSRVRNSNRRSASQQEKEDDQQTEREQRKKRAQETLRKREEAYRNSPQFKLDLAIGVLLDQCGYLLGLLVMIPIPIFLFMGLAGFLIGLIFSALTFPFWYRALIQKKPTIHPKHFWIAFKYVYINTNFKYYFFGLTNIVLFFTVVLDSFVNLIYLYGLLIPPIAFVFIADGLKLFKIPSKYKDLTLGVFPAIAHVFLLINIMFSHSERIEYHAIKYPDREDSIVLEFENNTYQDYQGIRFFMEKRNPGENYLILVVADGLFGVKTLKRYAYSSGVR